jgi:hypothetical protein
MEGENEQKSTRTFFLLKGGESNAITSEETGRLNKVKTERRKSWLKEFFEN